MNDSFTQQLQINL